MSDEEGFLYFKGGMKHAIRRRGENVSAVELEDILIKHSSIAECAAIGVPAKVGEEDIKVAIVPRAGTILDPLEVHSFCAEHMASFMVPRYIEVLDELPYDEVGKVMKDLLKEVSSPVWDAEG